MAQSNPPKLNSTKTVGKKGTGTVWSVVALVLSLCAVGGVGYLVYLAELQFRPQVASAVGSASQFEHEVLALKQQNEQLSDQLSESDKDVADQIQQQQSTIASLQQAVEATDADLKRRIMETADSVSAQIRDFAHASEAWKIEEIAYLLLMGSQRLQISGDVQSARQIWQVADQQLARINDPRLPDARAKVKEELETLEQLELVDVSSVAELILELTSAVDALPIRTPPLAQSESSDGDGSLSSDDSQPADQSMIDEIVADIWDDLKLLVSVKKIDQTAMPPFNPSLKPQLVDSIKLALFGAQIAALRGNDQIYRGNLAYVQKSIRDHFLESAPEVEDFTRIVDVLNEVSVELNIPDVSASLLLLQDVLSATTDSE